MKSTLLVSMTAVSLLAALATAQTLPRYTITDLGLMGPAGAPIIITNRGLISGGALVSGGADHAVFWYTGTGVVPSSIPPVDIGRPGLGGPNSIANGVNQSGQLVGQAETTTAGDDFCGFKALGLPGNGTACVPFLWQNGVMTPLPMLPGGKNGAAETINNRGEVAGMSETGKPDPNPGCPFKQFKPVIWKSGNVHELPTPGDADGFPFSINDNGQIVGASGDCNSAALIHPLQPLHILLWQNGTVTEIPNLGGTGHGLGNWAITINNRGQVVGASDLPGDEHSYGFLWSKETGTRPIAPLPGDTDSGAIGINDGGEIVGISYTAGTDSVRAFVLKNGAMADLNCLVIPGGPPLIPFIANGINSSGDIIGLAFDTSDNEVHGFLATPSKGTASECFSPASQNVARPTVLPENVRKLLRGRFRDSAPLGFTSAPVF